MRIVIIADSVDLQNAGIHVYTKSMIEALQLYTDHEIICIRQGKRDDIHFKNDVCVKPLLAFVEKDPFRVFYSIPHAIKKIKPDVVIEPAHFGPFLLPKSVKRITIIHDLTPVKYPQWHNRASSILQKIFLPSILKNTDLIIVNSKHTEKDLNECYSFTKGKSICIYPGANSFFKMKKEAFLSEKEPYFLTTATIEPRKNLLRLLDAYQIFREHSKSKFKLFVSGGKGWKSDEFYTKLEAHPYRKDIVLKGFVSNEELKELYSKAGAFIYPSLYEGFGFPVLEAMKCGAPCIVSSSSSLPEVGGDAVLYFHPESTDELAIKMVQLADDESLRLKLMMKGFEQSQKFTWKEFSSAFDRHVLKVLKSRK